jgi:hypothetical protein
MSDFQQQLSRYFDQFIQALSTDTGDWVVKGFIDIYQNIYTISGNGVIASGDLESKSGVVC